MRIAVLGAGGKYKTEASIVDACGSLGHQTLRVNVPGWSRALGQLAPRLLVDRISRFDPERIILTGRAMRLGGPALERLSARFPTAFWYFDPVFHPAALDFARRSRAVYVTYTHHLELFARAGDPPVRFLPQGVDPTESRPPTAIPPQYQCEVSFIGSGQYPLRHDALRSVAAVARLQIRGPGWEGASDDLPVAGGDIRGPRFVAAVAGAAISLGLAAHLEQRTTRASASNRMWKVLGCGGFFLGEYSEGIERFAREGDHCAWFRSTGEMLERLRHFLARPEERRRIADLGRAHALANHTYGHRVQLLLADRGYDLAG